MTQRIQGRDLREGDTIRIWHKPYRGTITTFRAHSDPHNLFGGEGRCADFAQTKIGMTIEPDNHYDLIERAR